MLFQTFPFIHSEEVHSHLLFSFEKNIIVSSYLFYIALIFFCIILGGSYVEGGWLRNAFRWKETVGAWEERPGHFNDIWKYWTDDGLGYFEFLRVGSVFFYILSSSLAYKFGSKKIK